jgi:NACalpha-BTF3-like transcription factor
MSADDQNPTTEPIATQRSSEELLADTHVLFTNMALPHTPEQVEFHDAYLRSLLPNIYHPSMLSMGDAVDSCVATIKHYKLQDSSVYSIQEHNQMPFRKKVIRIALTIINRERELRGVVRAEDAVDETDVDPDEITIVMDQAYFSRATAVKALKKHKNIVDAIYGTYTLS